MKCDVSAPSVQTGLLQSSERATETSKEDRVAVKFVKVVIFCAAGLVALPVILLMVAGVAMQVPAPKTEITSRKPFADYIGREYRVVGSVSALAWNDFPDKDKLLSISLMSPPLVRNRYVSYSKPLKPGQTVRIVSAWRSLTLDGFIYKYGVRLPGAGLPEELATTMKVNAHGVPDPLVYEPIEK
jgi:hypothetical protein